MDDPGAEDEPRTVEPPGLAFQEPHVVGVCPSRRTALLRDAPPRAFDWNPDATGAFTGAAWFDFQNVRASASLALCVYSDGPTGGRQSAK